ncbi:MAG: D-alanyl-D-alanine carboxypeptidase [Solirubrobacterales bacterium]|nr:D-alanyl-D-alanine carboxypeptidase [Solirubrobacterales bacterium]
MIRRAQLAVLLAGAGASAALSGCALTGSTGRAEPAGAAEVRTVDGRGVPTIPSQGANGPLLPVGPKPVPLAVKLEQPLDPVKVRFAKPPKAGLLFDLDTGEVLWRRNPTRVLPMASVTKIMTALLVDERVPPGGRVRITEQAVHTGGSKVGVLPLGKRIGVATMLYGLLLPSGNDAAVALAQRVSGTTREFVTLMNARAAAMHLSCTRFASPSGLVDAGNHTCAYDLAALGRALLDRPRLAGIVARRQAVLPFPIKGGKLYLYNHNPLLKQRYPGTLGVKTGYTDAAGKCLVAAVEQDGHRLGVVLLHSPDIGVQGIKLMDRGFAYERRTR